MRRRSDASHSDFAPRERVIPTNEHSIIEADIDIDACPDCGHEHLSRRRSVVGYPLGAVLLMVGFLAALPTLGASMILCVVGVFMMVPRTRCPECGWSKRN